MSQLESAIRLAKKGFHVFPLIQNSKLPAIDDFPNRATRDTDQIEKWWVDPVLGLEQPFNVGISTTRFGEDESLLVIDVDNKGKKKGNDEILKLELEGFELPPTFEQVTPSGGRHLVYRSQVSLRQGVNVLGAGLDVRARGGYIVGAGSRVEMGVYTAIEHDITRPPEWLVSRIGASRKRDDAPASVEGKLDAARAKGRAVQFLESDAAISVEGEGGNENAYRVACKVKDFGVDRATCLELLATHWNERCSPPWSEEELRTIVTNAYRYGTESVGSSAPEADFSSLVEKPKKSYLHEINDNYAVVYMEGSHFILHETVDEKGRAKRVFLTEATFKRRFSPFTVQSGKGRPQSQADIWLDWEQRREYAGVCFAPERKPRNNYYNLWRGFTCEPIPFERATAEQKRGLDMFLEHARENACQGDTKLFTWLMGYFAHMIQKPFERPLTTLVFRSRAKGTGKNALVDRVGRLLGSSHYLVAQDGRYLTSNFNGHMDSCLMLVLDEAFWSGDKTAEGKLKGLTTAPEIMIERKGKEPYVVDNLVRLVVIGNEDWLVPASHDERRYSVFEMGEGRKQDRVFFRTMRELLDEKGGCGLLLHYLQTFDLSQVDVNAAPNTAALLDQKLMSLEPFEDWWFDCLREGHIVHSDFTEGWPEKISKEQFRLALERYWKTRNIRNRMLSSVSIGRALKHCCKSAVTDQQFRDPITHKFIKEYRFPSLGQARKEWEARLGQEVKWE